MWFLIITFLSCFVKANVEQRTLIRIYSEKYQDIFWQEHHMKTDLQLQYHNLQLKLYQKHRKIMESGVPCY